MPAQSAGAPIRVLLVDQPAIRRGIRMLLELDPQIEVIGEAGDGAAATALARALHPHIILIDPALPGLDCARAAELRAAAPDSAVILLGLHDDPAMRADMQDCTAAAFVDKHDACESLLATVRRVAVEVSNNS